MTLPTCCQAVFERYQSIGIVRDGAALYCRECRRRIRVTVRRPMQPAATDDVIVTAQHEEAV